MVFNYVYATDYLSEKNLYSGVRITHQARISGKFLPIFLPNFGEIWLKIGQICLNWSRRKIPGLMRYAYPTVVTFWRNPRSQVFANYVIIGYIFPINFVCWKTGDSPILDFDLFGQCHKKLYSYLKKFKLAFLFQLFS